MGTADVDSSVRGGLAAALHELGVRARGEERVRWPGGVSKVRREFL
jgi:hypothetical protein